MTGPVTAGAGPPPAGAGGLVRPLAAIAAGMAAAAWALLLVRSDAGAAALAPWAAVAGLLAAWGLVRRPAAAACVVIALVVTDVSEILVRRHGWPSVLAIAVGVAVLAVVGRRATGLVEALAHPVLAAAGTYLAVRILSIAVARDAGLATASVLETARGVLLALVVASALLRRPAVRAAVATAVASATLLAAIAVVQAVTGRYDRDWGGLGRVKDAQIYADVFDRRVAGPVGDPNFFAELLVTVTPLALWAAEYAASTRLRVAAGAAVAVLAAGIAFTYSRGGLLALVVVAVLWTFSHRMTARRLALVASFGLVIAVAAGQALGARLATLSEFVPGGDDLDEHADSSFVERRLLTGTAWRMFVAAPVLGVGAGNYTVNFDAPAAEVGSTFREVGEDRPHYPHSLPLEIAAETGIVGLLAFGGVIVAALLGLERARRGADPAWSSLLRALQLAVVAHLTCGLFLHGALMRPLYVLLGLSAAAAVARAPAREAP